MSASTTFLASIVVILITSRLFGEIAQRLRQPAVIGQLLAGIVLGPSVLGQLWPGVQHALFLSDATQKAMLSGVGEFGVLLLLLLTGMDTDIRLVRKIGAPSISVSLMGVVIPLILGVALGLLLPASLIPDAGRRLTSALFLGVALSISSIKVLAMVVRDMDFARRDLGQIVFAAAIIEDSIGWLLIAVIFGLAGAGSRDVGTLLLRFAGLALFVVAILTIGHRPVSHAIRLVNDHFVSDYAVVTLILILMGAMALTTDLFGVQSVLGAFLAGVLVGQSPILTKRIAAQLRGMIASFFAPVFFALAGLGADLTILRSPAMLGWAVAVIVVASLGKFAGAFAGGWMGRLSRPESLALAVGMNARGSTEVIIASIGLSSGVLSANLYSMIVAMAAVTTSAMPPTLRWALARTPMRPGEKERLEREAFEARGFVTNMERFLIVASDQSNGRLAARLAGILAGSRGQPATMLPVQPRFADARPVPTGERAASDVKQGADVARKARPAEEAHGRDVPIKVRAESDAVAQMVQDEAPKGYDFLIVGLDPAEGREGGFNPDVTEAARAFGGAFAVAVARGAHKRDPLGAPLRILVPVTGAGPSRRAAEVAVELARASQARLDVLFIAGGYSAHGAAERRRTLADRHEEEVIREIVELADRRDQPVRVRRAASTPWPVAILEEAKRQGATLVVLGVALRPGDSLPFGETADRLLEASPLSLLFVAS